MHRVKGNNAPARRKLRNLSAIVGTAPMIAVAIGLYVIGIGYSIALSFTQSRLLPNFDRWVGWANYERLWDTSRWLVSVENIWLYGLGVIGVNLLLGGVLAAFVDRGVRQEYTLRTVMLYPYAMSLIVTGLVWQWMMDPGLGMQEAVRNWGFSGLSFAPLAQPSTAIYGVVIAGVWQGTGVTMVIVLAGLRGIDEDIWKATRVDGIATWKTYLFVALPMLRGALITAFVVQAISVVRVYDLIVAITGGGPGIATEMPAKFVIDHITSRANVALGMAGATMMLLPVLLLLAMHKLFSWRGRRNAFVGVK